MKITDTDKGRAISAVLKCFIKNKTEEIETEIIAAQNRDICLSHLLWALIYLEKISLITFKYKLFSNKTKIMLYYGDNYPVDDKIVDIDGKTIDISECKIVQLLMIK